MQINQNRAYVTLKMVGGRVEMVVSRLTRAVSDLELSVGDVLRGTRAGFSVVTIEDSLLQPDEFRLWFEDQQLNVLLFSRRYGVSVFQVISWLES